MTPRLMQASFYEITPEPARIQLTNPDRVIESVFSLPRFLKKKDMTGNPVSVFRKRIIRGPVSEFQ